MRCYNAAVESGAAAAATDRAAAQSSQLSEVPPLAVPSVHHRPRTIVSLSYSGRSWLTFSHLLMRCFTSPALLFQSRIFNVTVSNVAIDSSIKREKWKENFLVGEAKAQPHNLIWPVLSLTVCLFHSTWPWEESARLCKMRSAKKPWRSEIHHPP